MTYDNSVLNKEIKRRNNRFARFFGSFVLKLISWKIKGVFPKEKKMVLIVAPHTSNWDFVVCMLTYFALDIEIKWFGKHSIFKGPVGKLFRKWGGIPIERSKKHDVVSQAVDEFNQNESFILALSPEGTRSYIKKWKTGFYHIAKGAKVPILCVALNFKEKEIQVGPTIHLKEIKEDLTLIQSYFKKEMAKDEKKYNPKIY